MVVAAWQLVSARGVGQSTLALLRLVIARGCEQKGDKEWKERVCVCVWVSLVGGLKGRQGKGTSKSWRKAGVDTREGSQVNMRQVSIRV